MSPKVRAKAERSMTNDKPALQASVERWALATPKLSA